MAQYHSSYDYYSQQSSGFDGLSYQEDNSNTWSEPVGMQRSHSTHSQTTNYTVDSSDTTGSHSSGYPTGLPSRDSPIMEDAVLSDSSTGWYQTSSSYPDLSYLEPQDANQLVVATGSQYYSQDYYNNATTSVDSQQSPHELQFGFASQAFDSLIPDIEATAKQAADSALSLYRSRQMPAYEDYSVITTEVVDASVQWHRGQDQNASYREAVQRLLIDHLYQKFSETTPVYADITKVLEEAAYQLLARLQGQKVYQICYYAISAALAQLKQQLDEASGAAAASTVVAASSSSPSSLSNSRQHPEKQLYPCLVPGCKQKGFSRSADLERHHNMVHLDETKKKKFACDYKKCSRHEMPFFRQDHFRDHLRDFHKEDLPRRSKKGDASWWSGRSKYATESGWWRCNRCLVVRVSTEANGFTCPQCGASCEIERQRLRLGV
ncbi:zinc finger protein AEBP2 [Cladorrhinum sp. PSN332]|nr:zinc finger protein AEBP2 [Cladorrhinum sp. PSN332]